MLPKHSITSSNHSTIITIEDLADPSFDVIELDLPTSQALVSLCRVSVQRARQIVAHMNLMATDREIEMMEAACDLDAQRPWLGYGVRFGEQACKYVAGVSGVIGGAMAIADYGSDKSQHTSFSLGKAPALVGASISLLAGGLGFAAGEYANKQRYALRCEKQFVAELVRILRAQKEVPDDIPSSTSRTLRRIALSPLLN